jgi:predicted phage replisome organizer
MSKIENKWLKIRLDIFENEKINYILELPDGEKIVLLWFRLLTMAGKCNDGGKIYLTEKIPYTVKKLARLWNVDEELIKQAFSTFKLLNMISISKGIILVTGWVKHQSKANAEELRKYNREAKRRSRARLKGQDFVNDLSLTSQDCQSTDKDKDVDEDEDEDAEEDIYLSKPSAQTKHTHGQYSNVLLTDGEYLELRERFPDSYAQWIERLSEGIERMGYKYRSHFLAIIHWARREEDEQSQKNKSSNPFYELLSEGK